jgi:hypothetical protein
MGSYIAFENLSLPESVVHRERLNQKAKELSVAQIHIAPEEHFAGQLINALFTVGEIDFESMRATLAAQEAEYPGDIMFDTLAFEEGWLIVTELLADANNEAFYEETDLVEVPRDKNHLLLFAELAEVLHREINDREDRGIDRGKDPEQRILARYKALQFLVVRTDLYEKVSQQQSEGEAYLQVGGEGISDDVIAEEFYLAWEAFVKCCQPDLGKEYIARLIESI